MATTMPSPGLVGRSVFSSIHPLKTQPNPPSPSKVSALKFLVAFLRSFKVNDFNPIITDASLGNDDVELTILKLEVILLEFVEPEVLEKGSGFSAIKNNFNTLI